MSALNSMIMEEEESGVTFSCSGLSTELVSSVAGGLDLEMVLKGVQMPDQALGRSAPAPVRVCIAPFDDCLMQVSSDIEWDTLKLLMVAIQRLLVDGNVKAAVLYSTAAHEKMQRMTQPEHAVAYSQCMVCSSAVMDPAWIEALMFRARSQLIGTKRKEIEKSRIDIVHAHHGEELFSGLMTSFLSGELILLTKELELLQHCRCMAYTRSRADHMIMTLDQFLSATLAYHTGERGNKNVCQTQQKQYNKMCEPFLALASAGKRSALETKHSEIHDLLQSISVASGAHASAEPVQPFTDWEKLL